MKSIGIKLADGSFYPLLEEGNPEKRTLDLTTVMDNQTKVQVEVYRTETGTLEGAEYLDTLEIKNLKPHENGEPTLCLAIDVDENNELSAEIRDPETGKKSEIQVTLQSRTLAGLDNPDFEEEDDVTISDNDLEKAGLDDFVEKKEFDSDEIPLPAEDFSFDDVNEPSHADDTILNDDNTESEDNETEETVSASEDDIFGENSLDLPEFGETSETEEDSSLTEPAAEEDATIVPEEPADDNTDVQEETITEDNDFSTDEDFTSSDLPAFDETMFDSLNEETTDSNSDTLTDFNDDIFAESETTEAPAQSEETEMTEDLTLPDFDESESVPDETQTEITDSTQTADSIEDTDSSYLDLPDFDDLEATNLDTPASDLSSEDSSFSLPDFDDETSDSLTDNDEDFTLPPDFDTNYGEENLTFDDQPKNPTFAPSTSMFSNLYDKETLEGTSGSYDFSEEKDSSSKTKVPVIICVVCAIICILAVLLTLFVIPSKLNIFSKTEKTESEEIVNSIEELPEEIPELTIEEPEPAVEEVAPAKEDTIVIAETPAVVVPVEPEPMPEKIPDIRYKIVWGDTLWDISTAYYKTPWKYKKLARYNKIKNPDRIISGRYILIPAE